VYHFKGEVHFDWRTILFFALVNLHERGLLGKLNYLYSPCITSRERFIKCNACTFLN